MLTQKQLQKFFEAESIPLAGFIQLDTDQYARFVLNAANVGYSFLSFLKLIIINTEEFSITTDFINWDDLYESYCCFMTGLMIDRNLPTN